jgi:hypothetical protein
VPRNSPTAFVIAFFAVAAGFALIWQIWWLAILGLLAILVTVLVFGWSENREREIPANEMARMEPDGAFRDGVTKVPVLDDIGTRASARPRVMG